MNILIFLLVILFSFFNLLEARQPYHALVNVDAVDATVSAPNLLDFKRGLSTRNLEKLIPFYTPTSAVGLAINLRGINVAAAFAANSTTLVVTIPQAGITQSFTGGTRDESLALFKDFLHNAGQGTSSHFKGRLLKAYARYSPIDPIAGNPNSLMALMAQSDYLLGNLSPFSGCDSCWSAQPIEHQYQIGADYGRAFASGFDTTIVNIPLRYSYSPDLKWALILDAPLTYLRNGGASSLVGSVGVGIRLPITQAWSLTPVLRLGSGGSLDLCTSGAFVTTGVTSVYNLNIHDYVVSFTNYAGYFTSTNLWLTGLNFNYHLHNYVFKNGFSIHSCEGFKVCNRMINVGVSFEDSYFAREHLFMDHFDEIALTFFTTGISPCLNYDCLSIGFSYQFGNKHYRGYYFNSKYQF